MSDIWDENPNLTPEDREALRDWDATNERRCDLIDRSILDPENFTRDERKELDHLQWIADVYLGAVAPLDFSVINDVIADLKARGQWIE